MKRSHAKAAEGVGPPPAPDIKNGDKASLLALLIKDELMTKMQTYLMDNHSNLLEFLDDKKEHVEVVASSYFALLKVFEKELGQIVDELTRIPMTEKKIRRAKELVEIVPHMLGSITFLPVINMESSNEETDCKDKKASNYGVSLILTHYINLILLASTNERNVVELKHTALNLYSFVKTNLAGSNELILDSYLRSNIVYDSVHHGIGYNSYKYIAQERSSFLQNARSFVRLLCFFKLSSLRFPSTGGRMERIVNELSSYPFGLIGVLSSELGIEVPEDKIFRIESIYKEISAEDVIRLAKSMRSELKEALSSHASSVHAQVASKRITMDKARVSESLKYLSESSCLVDELCGPVSELYGKDFLQSPPKPLLITAQKPQEKTRIETQTSTEPESSSSPSPPFYILNRRAPKPKTNPTPNSSTTSKINLPQEQKSTVLQMANDLNTKTTNDKISEKATQNTIIATTTTTTTAINGQSSGKNDQNCTKSTTATKNDVISEKTALNSDITANATTNSGKVSEKDAKNNNNTTTTASTDNIKKEEEKKMAESSDSANNINDNNGATKTANVNNGGTNGKIVEDIDSDIECLGVVSYDDDSDSGSNSSCCKSGDENGSESDERDSDPDEVSMRSSDEDENGEKTKKCSTFTMESTNEATN